MRVSPPDQIHCLFQSAPLEASGGLIIFDRDGVIIEDTGYPSSLDSTKINFELLQLLQRLKDSGLQYGFASNQGGIGLGLYTWENYLELTTELNAVLDNHAARPDFWISCAVHPRAVVDGLKYSAHHWRKPGPGMIEAAIKWFCADKSKTLFIGDRHSDLLAAKAAGVQGYHYSGWIDGIQCIETLTRRIEAVAGIRL